MPSLLGFNRLHGVFFAVLSLAALPAPAAAQSVDVMGLVSDDADYILSVDPRVFVRTEVHSVLIPEFAGDTFLFQNPQASTVRRLFFSGVLNRFPVWEMVVAVGRFSYVPAAPRLDFLGRIGVPVGYLEPLAQVSAQGFRSFGLTVGLRTLESLPDLLDQAGSLVPLAAYADAFLAPPEPVLWGAFRIADFSLENAVAGDLLRPDRLSRLGDVRVFVSLGSLVRGRVRVVLDFQTARIAGTAVAFIRNALADAAARSRPLQNLTLRADGSRVNAGFNLDARMLEGLTR